MDDRALDSLASALGAAGDCPGSGLACPTARAPRRATLRPGHPAVFGPGLPAGGDSRKFHRRGDAPATPGGPEPSPMHDSRCRHDFSAEEAVRRRRGRGLPRGAAGGSRGRRRAQRVPTRRRQRDRPPGPSVPESHRPSTCQPLSRPAGSRWVGGTGAWAAGWATDPANPRRDFTLPFHPASICRIVRGVASISR